MAFRVRIIYDRPGWAYYHRAVALQRYAPADFSVTLGSQEDKDFGVGPDEVDLVFVINYVLVATHRERLRARMPHAVWVTSFNTGWPRRREYLDVCQRCCDAVIMVNRQSWDRAGRRPGTYPIANGVDREVFHVRVPPADRTAKVLWCGSLYHQKLKGYDAVLRPMAGRLERAGLPVDLFLTKSTGSHLLSAEQMADWYNSGTIYVCASELEGTPNPALEAAACGCTVVSTPVGNMPELIRDGENGFLVARDVDSFVNGVLAAHERYRELAASMLSSIRTWDWRARSHEFYELFRLLLRAPTAGVPGNATKAS